MIPGELQGKKVKVRMEVIEGDVPWIIGQEWMEEWGVMINMRKEISFGKGETKVKWREDSKGYMKVELRPRRRERESGVTANGKSFQRDSSDRHGRGRRGNIPSNGGHCNPLFPGRWV